jgi:hypothetical protein
MPKCWIYSATEAPKIVEKEEAQSFYDKGWADSPIDFIKTTDCGVDPDDEIAVQALGEAIVGVKAMANGALNLEEMKPKELKEYAKKNFDQDIKGNRKKLLTKVRDLINDHGE